MGKLLEAFAKLPTSYKIASLAIENLQASFNAKASKKLGVFFCELKIYYFVACVKHFVKL